MAQGKKSDGSQFEEVGGGRIKDKDKKSNLFSKSN